MTRRVQVIVNPASGRDEAILGVLNEVFTGAGYQWDLTLTTADGDTAELARQAAEGADVVAAYGGDDTVTAVAAGLQGLDVPLAILPGGTANILAQDLRIPMDLQQAASLIVEGSTRRCLDLGRVGDRYFSNRVSTGLLASMVIGAEREAKNRFGELAYAFKGLQAALGEQQNSLYTVEVDGETHEGEGVAAFIANTGNLSIPGVSFAPTVLLDDGLLDVLVIRRLDVDTVVSLVASAAQVGGATETLPYWQGREITLTVDPPHPAAIDGEELGQTPVTATVVPAAIEVIVPPPADAGSEEAQ